MTLESKSEIVDKSGGKITTTKRSVRTYIPRGSQNTSTPWGVTLKPVPRKTVTEEVAAVEKSKGKSNPPSTNTKADLNKPKSVGKVSLLKSQLNFQR